MTQRRPGSGSKIAGSGHQIPKKEVHHWWPKGLSQFWAARDGLVGRLAYDGTTLRSPPDQFGAIANAHFIKLNGPWNATIEPIFDFADNNFPWVVRRLVKEYATPPANGARALLRLSERLYRNRQTSIIERLEATPLNPSEREILGEFIASLIARSPGFRERILTTVNHYRGGFGLPDIEARNNIIAGNIHQWYGTLVEDLSGGKLVLLRSSGREFVMGEGYLNNLAGSSRTPNHRALVPITPNLCIFAFSTPQFPTQPELCNLTLTDREVEQINFITQVYTKRYLFFRKQPPRATAEFRQCKFMELKYHMHPLLEGVIAGVCKFRITAS